MSLRTKLSRMDAAGPASPTPPQGPIRAGLLDDLRARIQTTLERSSHRLAAIAALAPPAVDTCELPFATCETALGPLHVRVQRLSGAHRTGHAPVACARDASSELLALLALDPGLVACDPSEAL